MSFPLRFTLVMGYASLASCISHIGVSKVDNSDPEAAAKVSGIRYSLPQPFIVGTPKGDGKIEYTVEYLPDPENEYAVNAWSFMAKHKLDIKRDTKGLLKSSEYAKDDTEVAKQAVATAGSLAETYVKALNKAGDSEAPEVPASHIKTVPGPVMYRIVEDREMGVRLEPVNFKVSLNGRESRSRQPYVQTTGTKQAAAGAKSGDSPAADAAGTPPRLLPEAGPAVVELAKSGAKDPFLIFTYNQGIEPVPSSASLSVDGAPHHDWIRIEPVPGFPTKVRVTLLKEKGIQPGNYELNLVVKKPDKNSTEFFDETISIVVRE